MLEVIHEEGFNLKINGVTRRAHFPSEYHDSRVDLVAGLGCEFLASQWESLIIGLMNNGTTGGI